MMTVVNGDLNVVKHMPYATYLQIYYGTRKRPNNITLDSYGLHTVYGHMAMI